MHGGHRPSSFFSARFCTRMNTTLTARDHDRQHGRDRGAVADLLRLEELAVREVRGHDRGVAGPAAGQGVDRAEHLQRGDRAGQRDDEDLRADHADGDRPEPLEPVGAVELGGLVELGVDPLQRGHEDDDRVAELHPDHDDHDAGSAVSGPPSQLWASSPRPIASRIGLSAPFCGRRIQPMTIAGDHRGQHLRQVVGGAQEAREPAAELLADEVEQHRGEQQPEQRRHHDHRDDHRDGVAERRPEDLRRPTSSIQLSRPIHSGGRMPRYSVKVR